MKGRHMRKQILGATAAILGASALSFGLPAAPTQGVAWKSMTQIPFPAGTVTDVDVVSTGPGDAVAAAVINGAVHAYTAVDGLWTGYSLVRSDVDATGLVLAANDTGDVAIGWEENVAGDTRLRVSRQLTYTSWTGLQLLTPAGSDIVGTAELGISANGRVFAAATVDDADHDNELLVTEWAEGKIPQAPEVISPADAWSPSLDVNAKGEALLAYNYTGIVDDVLTVAHRTAAGGWNLGQSTHNSGNVAAAPDVAISDNGQGQVVYSVVKNGFYVAESSRVLPDGTVQNADYISPLDEYVYEPSVDINATGSALFTWVAKKDGLASVRYSSAANAADPGASAKLPGASVDITNPTARISDSGLRVLQHYTGGYITTNQRTSQIQPYAAVSTTNGFAPDHAVDVDDEGNAVMVGYKAGGVASIRFLDAAGPDVALDALPFATIDKTIPVNWTADDSLGSVSTTDVYASSVAWNKATFTTPAIVANDVVGGHADVAASSGTTYCIQVRTSDTAGNATTTEKRCTTVPLDDRTLLGADWNRVTGQGHFKNTLTTTKQHNAVLTRKSVKAKRLVLVVQKVTNGGTVKVTFAGDSLGSFSLQGSGKKKQISLASFPSVKTGTLTIKVTSATGKPVNIDGLIVAK
jgi:hypothetical protein